MKTLALDIDGVLADLVAPYLEEYGGFQRQNIKWTMWDVIGISEGEWWQKYREYWLSGKVPLNEPRETVKYVLERLKRMGIKVFIVTKRPWHLANATKKWLLLYGIQEPLIICDMDTYKVELGFDYVIDDNPHEVVKFCTINSNSDRVLYLYGQPWNECVSPASYGKVENNVVRVQGLNGMLQHMLENIKVRNG